MQAKRAALMLALVVTGLVACQIAENFHTNTWIFRDGRFYINVNEGIVERGSLEDVYAHSWYSGTLGWNRNLPASFSNIALGRDGTYYSFRPYLLPLLSTPLYFAFGLVGPLLFNAAALVTAAYFAFIFVRRFTPSDLSAGLATLLFLFGSGVRLYLYDYSVDILLLAFLAFSLASTWRGHGFRAGCAFGIALLLKPTTLLIAPVLLFPLLRKRDFKSLRQVAIGLAIAIGFGGLMNTWMFGRPWWFGYHRVLAVENGVPTIVSDTSAFTTPLLVGLEDIWSGQWGVSHRWTAFLPVPLFLIALFRRHPAYALVAGFVASANAVLFAKFQYHDDRYLFPAALVIAPAAAAAIETIGIGIAALSRTARVPFPRIGPALLTATIAVWIAMSSVLFRETPIEQRFDDQAYALGAYAWGHGHFDLADLEPRPPVQDPRQSAVTRGRFGHWLPRASPLAVAVATPFAAVAGPRGLVFLHLLAGGWLAFSIASILRPRTGPVLAGWLTAALFLIPPLRDSLATAGPPLLASALALGALERALRQRWVLAGVLSILAAWTAVAPWLIPGAVLCLALRDGRRATLRSSVAIAGALALACVAHLVLIGRPFASPDDFVLFESSHGVETVRIASGLSWQEAIAWFQSPGAARGLLPMLVVAILSLVWLARAHPAWVGALALGFASFVIPSARESESLFLLAALAFIAAGVGLRRFVHSLDRGAAWAMPPRRRVGVAVAALSLLLAVGVGRRVSAARAPWRMASEDAVKSAQVHLGRIPCDFLAWEHMAWECSHYDREPYSVTGLNVWHGVFVGGRRMPLFVVSSSPRSPGTRRVKWVGLPPASAFQLTWAVPDRTVGVGTVRVRANGVEVDRFDLPSAPTGRLAARSIAMPPGNDPIELEIEVERAGPTQTTVGFDGWFIEADQ